MLPLNTKETWFPKAKQKFEDSVNWIIKTQGKTGATDTYRAASAWEWVEASSQFLVSIPSLKKQGLQETFGHKTIGTVERQPHSGNPRADLFSWTLHQGKEVLLQVAPRRGRIYLFTKQLC